MDKISAQQRSWNMSQIKNKDTKPEKFVRSALHNSGYRFRLHSKDLPGKPDIVLAKYMTIIFVNGCFWHRHEGCKYSYMPKTNKEKWQKKFKDNVDRDLRVYSELMDLGWRVIILWECEVRSGQFINKLENEGFKIIQKKK